MKQGVNIVGLFSKAKGEDGSEYFTGSLDTSFFKKIKQDEANVNLLPWEFASACIVDLFRKSGKKADLVMLAGLGEEDKNSQGKVK